ncbi:MAG: hypothetical protein MN733_29125 [Nitrososphaera sp.]|nr:hypothetical protein [Nitrososphaera sp.]
MMDFEIVDASTIPAPMRMRMRMRNNPLLDLKPGEACVKTVASANEQQVLQNSLSAKARVARKHTGHSYRTTKFSDGDNYKVAVICSED